MWVRPTVAYISWMCHEVRFGISIRMSIPEKIFLSYIYQIDSLNARLFLPVYRTVAYITHHSQTKAAMTLWREQRSEQTNTRWASISYNFGHNWAVKIDKLWCIAGI